MMRRDSRLSDPNNFINPRLSRCSEYLYNSAISWFISAIELLDFILLIIILIIISFRAFFCWYQTLL